ncbi:MAG: hypothetical protein Hyperionvirus17_12 [Hyperionvirus sp.]|uniref:Uncharacterized protein n=1 Tax=Hyperionvirus sp. TaxID=2487770 RepID=A0A3G5AAI1_9VIRU|nr:MAG: hypothetical protein Hyperionvirus17_12 [Hyperionvirus sp.]
MKSGNGQYVYYDIIKKQRYIKKVSDKVERIMLDQLSNRFVGGVDIAEKQIFVFKEMFEGKQLLRTLASLYKNLKELQEKLENISGKIREAAKSLDPIPAKLKTVSDIRGRYDKIIKRLKDEIDKNYYSFDMKNGSVSFSDDDVLFLKSEKAKWDNVVVLYINFINNYKEMLGRIKSKSRNEVFDLVENEVDKNLSEYDVFVKDLSGTKVELEKEVGYIMGLNDVHYDRADVVISKERIEGISGSEGIGNAAAYLKEFKFTANEIVKPENIDILAGVFGVVGMSFDKASGAKLNLEIPKFDLRVTQSGGSIFTNTLISKLNQFGIRLQETNGLMGEVRSLNNEYINLSIRYNHYVIYTMLIATSVNKKVRTYFKYLNEPILSHYYGIIVELDRRITVGEYDEKIKYFDIYHYFTIKRMRGFIKFLIGELSPNEIIVVERCTGTVRDSFVVFNHFKNILNLI